MIVIVLKKSFANQLTLGFCLVLLTTFTIADDTPGDNCVGPSGIPGFCIRLNKCASLAGILTEDPLKVDRVRFLQSSTCSFDNDEPFVCCPKNEVQPDAPAASTSSRPEESISGAKRTAQDLEKHPNFSLLPKSCGKPAPESQSITRIIGGQKAALGAFPWMALVSFLGPDGRSQLACGGTLISPSYVLTAAHCVTHLPEGFSINFIRIGEFDETKNPDCESGFCAPPFQEIEVEEVVPHAEYNAGGRQENDVAVIRLKTPATLGPFIQPVCLPQGKVLERDPDKEGYATIAGWGRTIYYREEGSKVLQQVSVPIVPSNRCAEVLLRRKVLDPSQMCAGGEKGKDSCKGDSGGPLMKTIFDNSTSELRTYQLGIVSVGAQRCGSAIPAIYTKVSYFIHWILDHMGP